MAAPLLITVTGNLEGALEFIQVRGWGSENFWQWVGIKGLDGRGGQRPVSRRQLVVVAGYSGD